MGLAYPQDAERPWRRPNCHRIVFLATPKTPDFEFWAFGPIGQKPSKTGVFQGVEKTCFRGSKPGKTCFRGGMSVNCYLENGQKVRKTVFDKGGGIWGGYPRGGSKPPQNPVFPLFPVFRVFAKSQDFRVSPHNEVWPRKTRHHGLPPRPLSDVRTRRGHTPPRLEICAGP